ncbi:ACT domain-containing protein [Mammaliicoccus fleurettii]|uniref:Prephenate dehydratase n=1 Tax=Mammaliicoccus fleurettii TaxID=150056 RepID=A0ABS5MMY9_9STAP|nr:MULTISPECIES: prephenate dehydratase domain-containing protein [Mammaliicoccus]MBL0847606.1 ACT domain-containing protein [Mammaliicoccus fleurettii]MBS3673105.1 ACT domain-containing protein [Mammaliicoccus fleurettii]MBS3697290.1 ACT domain-containing protein [Mammaliicoccus fleurettii]PTE32637.1 prephenate dehydratase [Mammaliicoccus fleurettii]
MKLYYLGPLGTFSHMAALKYKQNEIEEYIPKSNLYEVVKAIETDPQNIAIAPIENSIEGTINIIADSLTEQKIHVIDELHLDISFSLYVKKGTKLEDINEVVSIAPAINQTSKFIKNHNFTYRYSDSTVQSLDEIDDHSAAIAPIGLEETNNEIIALHQHIEDYPHNTTRFLVLSAQEKPVKKATDSILLITPDQDKPGLLASILNTFALFNINLSWIESRPLKTQLGMYHFFVQADCSADDVEMKKVITILKTLEFNVKVLGNFDKHI